MAIVIRYFGTSDGPGGNDGTTWNKRSTLFSGGAWSTVLSGFDFSGADSLIAMVGTGNYAITATLQASVFTNGPTAANPLFMAGCDLNGNVLAPTNPFWTCDLPDFDVSAYPVLATTTNIATIAGSNNAFFERCM